MLMQLMKTCSHSLNLKKLPLAGERTGGGGGETEEEMDSKSGDEVVDVIYIINCNSYSHIIQNVTLNVVKLIQ